MTNPACRNCGDEAVDALMVLGHEQPVPLCGGCLDHAVTFCGSCDRRLFCADGHRTFGSPTLYCQTCHDDLMQAARSHALPEMNEVRR